MNKLRNVDRAEQAHFFRTLALSLSGATLGAAAGGLLFGLAGFLLGAPMGFALVFLLSNTLAKGAGALAGTIYGASGNSTPAKREYSHPQALEARGHYQEALQAYQACCTEFPEDPEPYLRVARLYRNELHQYDDALAWFKKARAEATMTRALELLVTQEIVEIHTHKLSTPQRAIPELARLADRFPGTEAAQWARQRLGELRAALVQNQEAQTRSDRAEPR